LKLFLNKCWHTEKSMKYLSQVVKGNLIEKEKGIRATPNFKRLP